MAEYIEREALYEKAYWHGEHPDVGNPFPEGVDAIDIKDVDAIPAADVAPVRHGRWVLDEKRHCVYCSECGNITDWVGNLRDVLSDEHYCSNCGALMDGGPDA